jgi:hypothetical protein
VRATTRDAINDPEARLYKFMYDHLRIVRSATSTSSCFAWVAYVQSPYFLPDGPPMQIFQWKTFNLCGEKDPRWLHIVQLTLSLNQFAKAPIMVP